MLKSTLRPNELADAAFAASRQMWLAGLGAAVVAREWARRDASTVFKSLVKEGSTMENQVIRAIGDRIETSAVVASAAWNQARETALSTVRMLSATVTRAIPGKAPAMTPKDARKRGRVIKKSPSHMKRVNRSAKKA